MAGSRSASVGANASHQCSNDTDKIMGDHMHRLTWLAWSSAQRRGLENQTKCILRPFCAQGDLHGKVSLVTIANGFMAT